MRAGDVVPAWLDHLEIPGLCGAVRRQSVEPQPEGEYDIVYTLKSDGAAESLAKIDLKGKARKVFPRR